MLGKDADYYLELQTQTGWGRTLASFVEWCAPTPGLKTLDVGCGPGLVPALFAQMGCLALGVDLDLKMFHPRPLHSTLAVANAYMLPFEAKSFDMLTASNLLFLLDHPAKALMEMKRLLRGGGSICMLNPSENLSTPSAVVFAEERKMEGLARETLLRWAGRAEAHYHWNELETADLYAQAGMRCLQCDLKMGPGFARFSRGAA